MATVEKGMEFLFIKENVEIFTLNLCIKESDWNEIFK